MPLPAPIPVELGFPTRASDADIVEQARKHILELATNPYYYEAFRRLLSSGQLATAVGVGRRGPRLPTKLGALAARFQWPKRPGKPGRPSTVDPVLRKWLSQIDRPGTRRGELVATLRALVRVALGGKADEAQKETLDLVHAIALRERAYRKRKHRKQGD